MVLQAAGEVGRIQAIAKGAQMSDLPFECLEHAIGCDKISMDVQSKILVILDCLTRLQKADEMIQQKRDSQEEDRELAKSIRLEMGKLVKEHGSIITKGILSGFNNNQPCTNPKNICDFCCYRVQSEKAKVIGTIVFDSDMWTQVDIEKLHLSGEYPKSTIN